VIGVLPDSKQHRMNLITLCFDMYCSYKPPMMAFAIWHRSHTFSLLKVATECVLGVPGRQMADVAMFCGTRSGRSVDKASTCGLSLIESEFVAVPGIEECVANVEVRIARTIRTGDHVMVICEVRKFGVDRKKKERCLLSLGPENTGYEVLAHQGVHRIGAVKA
jgi:flavin reductase (DIM6/NTAB) family NADH-FMN oxidoreductase RutF